MIVANESIIALEVVDEVLDSQVRGVHSMAKQERFALTMIFVIDFYAVRRCYVGHIGVFLAVVFSYAKRVTGRSTAWESASASLRCLRRYRFQGAVRSSHAKETLQALGRLERY